MSRRSSTASSLTSPSTARTTSSTLRSEASASVTCPSSPTLIDTVQGQRIAYAEVQGESRLYTARTMVRDLEARYGIIRSQALTPRESLEFIRKLLGEL
ncbi:Scr1 family TA system antitoxin-like transcriptional regulator [Streptomyces parvus]|uniref:Scr1 family TA system antitoxin-like transcriptional regulator n=1 Tax=Streptomyces parvus TaxID=66428 RepID=UPI0035578C28